MSKDRTAPFAAILTLLIIFLGIICCLVCFYYSGFFGKDFLREIDVVEIGGLSLVILLAVVWIILIKSRNKTSNNASDNKHEVFLTKEEIEGIELRGEIPILRTPVLMKQNEVVLFYCQAIKQEIKKRVIGRTGGYAGASIRIFKGFSIHTGRVAGSPVYGDVCNHYPGEFILTTQRFIFLND